MNRRVSKIIRYEKIITLFIAIFIFQENIIIQTCSYLLLKNNAVLEISIFDKKGNPNGKVVCKVISSNGAEEKVSSKVFNEKGKELINAEEVYNCDENNFSVDVKAILPEDQSKSMNMKDMEIKANNA